MSQDLKIPQGTFLGHPKGLYLLFATEMWERFSFYGMRALLVLYAAAATHAVNPGLGWADAQALKLYGWYLGLVYGTAIFGGWIADNWLGQRKAVILGGLVMAAGQFMLAAPLDTLGTSGAFSLPLLGIAFPETPASFYLGLVLMCVGNGFFKPNISTMVGDLYPQGDARRDGAFVIFYMGINVGAFLAPLVCSTLGEDPAYGWRVGFFAAGIGMLLSVVIQLAFAQRYIGDVGRVPAAHRSLALAGGIKQPLTQVERDRLRVIFVIFTFVVIFWATFEQAGGLMNLFADKYTNREMGSFLVPTGWFQSLNPLFIVLLGIPFSMLWTRLGARGKNPATPVKMYLGLAQVALGFVCLVIAVFEMQALRGHEVQHDLARARLSVPHHGRAVHQPGRPLDDHQARTAAARFADDGCLVPRESFRQHARRLHRRVHREHGPVRLDGEDRGRLRRARGACRPARRFRWPRDRPDRLQPDAMGAVRPHHRVDARRGKDD